MLARLRQYLKNPDLNHVEALSLLRMVFLLMFAMQLLVAALLALVLAVVFERSGVTTPLVAQILIFLAFFQLPFAVYLPQLAVRVGGRQAALSATIMSAVLLSVPAYFTSFAALIGSPMSYLVILFAILMGYYALGLFMVSGFAQIALQPQKTEAS